MPTASTAIDRIRQSFVDRMGHSAESDGMSPIAGRLFATLVLSDTPLSLDELAEAIGVSKASVSTDARRLFEKGIVERVTKPGDRRDYYELSPDFFAATIRNRVDKWRRFQQLANEVRAKGSKLSATVRGRLDSIDEIHAFVVDRIEDALNSWERTDAKPPTRTSTRRRRSA